MQVFVKTLTGKTVTLQVEDSALVMDIKAKIEEKEGIPICQQTLFNATKILARNEISLYDYNVSNESTLQMSFSFNLPNTEVENNQIKNRKDNDDKDEVIGREDACENFKDNLVKSMTVEMNREVEKKTAEFKKLKEKRIELDLKVSELEETKDQNERELDNRKQTKNKFRFGLQMDKYEAVKEKQAKDQKIWELQKESEKLELIIGDKDKKIKKIVQDYEAHKEQIERKNRKLEEEISTLKRKRVDIKQEENGLFKKNASHEWVEFLSNSIEEKKKALQCPVCFDTAEVPIFKCIMDHLICNKCLPKLHICPECRKPYCKNPVRHRFAEEKVEEIEKLSMKRKTILDGV